MKRKEQEIGEHSLLQGFSIYKGFLFAQRSNAQFTM